MNYLDLFSGCGGFRRGLEEAGFTFEWEGHSEIDKPAKSVYEKHYPESEDLGDVSKIVISELPKGKYIVTAGWPCQDNSIAGKRKGQSGGLRSGLFDEVVRILFGLIEMGSEVIFIGENVKGLYSVNDGVDFLNTITRLTFLDTGLPQLTLESQLCNTRWFLPQNRERIYFVGYSGKRSRPKVFPIQESNGRNFETVSKRFIIRGRDKNTAGCLRTRGINQFDRSDLDNIIFIERNQKNIDGDYAYTIDSVNTGGVSIKRVGVDISNAINCGGYLERGARGRDENGKTYLTGQPERRIRRLTPIECARLQGFPDDWHGDVSDTQAYKMYGNAVSVPVVKALMSKLKPFLLTEK